MAENRRTHRIARAASRAARTFQESQRADDERIAQERARLAAEERTVEERPAAGSTAAPVVAGAARRAAQEFQERQRADDERLKAERERLRAEDEERRAAREAERLRLLEERDAAEAGAGLVHPLLRLARWWWLAMGLLLAGGAAALIWNGVRAERTGGPVIDPLTGMESVGPLGGATGQYVMGGFTAVLALLALWGWLGLARRRRGAISTLTFLAVVVAIPAFARGNALLIVLAALLLVGAVLVWLPPVRSRVRR